MSDAHDGPFGGSGPRGAAALTLSAATIAASWPLLGGGVLLAVPIALLSAAVASGAMPPRGTRAGNVLAAAPLLWGLMVLLLTMPSALIPTEFVATMQQLGRDLALAVRDGSGRDPGSTALVGWLLLTGVAWSAGSRRAARTDSASNAFGFILYAAPLLLLALTTPSDGDHAWLGAVGLIASLLWATRGRLRTALPVAIGIGTVAIVGAAVIGLGEPWNGLDRQGAGGRGGGEKGQSGLTALDTEQDYGPNPDTGGGSTMFQIRSAQPGLWRMQTLDQFDGLRWSVAANVLPVLPEPMAATTLSTVTLDGLRDRRAAAPGRITSLSGGGGPTTIGPGEATEFPEPPRGGSGYAATSDVVRVTADELETIRIPLASDYRQYTSVGRLTDEGLTGPAISLVDEMRPEHALSEFGQTLAIANRLAGDETSQLEVVARVLSYLREEGRFTYSLDVARPGPMPIHEFLLQTRTGYCQHFAGAAAMLLRMTGVPTRVVAGFGTGERVGDAFKVRDRDAHAWIEVYFRGVGWVTFDPTPSAAAALVPPGIDPLGGGDDIAGAQARSLSISGPLVAAAIFLPLLLGMIALAIRWWQASPSLEAALVRLVPAAAGSPAVTFSQLREALEAIGPQTSALAGEAELRRFSAGEGGEPQPHVRRRIWAALVADVGRRRALWILIAGSGPRGVLPTGAKPSSASVAPPG